MDLSKDAQLSRSPGGNRLCPTTGILKRDCDCYSCRGRRNRAKGKTKQRATRKTADKLFGKAGPTQTVTANEENWRHTVRIEVKAGKQIESLTKRFLAAEAQSNASKAVGDSRPFIFAAAPDGMSDQIWAFKASDLARIV